MAGQGRPDVRMTGRLFLDLNEAFLRLKYSITIQQVL